MDHGDYTVSVLPIGEILIGNTGRAFGK